VQVDDELAAAELSADDGKQLLDQYLQLDHAVLSRRRRRLLFCTIVIARRRRAKTK